VTIEGRFDCVKSRGSAQFLWNGAAEGAVVSSGKVDEKGVVTGNIGEMGSSRMTAPMLAS